MNISYGTPPQTFPVLPDLGSGDFTVQSSLMPASEKGNDPVYTPTASSTSHQLSGYTYSECYSSGYCDSGVVFTDTLTFGGITVPCVPVQAINSASSASSNSQSGNIGLSFGTPQSASPRGVSGFLWSIRPYLAGLCS
jgi:aspergillopepsin I